MPSVVCKFGGSSLKDGVALEKVLSIIEKDQARRYIVVSAPGKRFDGDEKVTDLFIKAHGAVQKDDLSAFKRAFGLIRERFAEFAFPETDDELDEIEIRLLQGASFAYAASRGEYLTARGVANVLGVPMLDTAKCLYIRNGKTRFKSYALVRKELLCDRAVIPGFYGRAKKGVAVYPRGGGDITGGVIARAVNADLYENWTDVSGVYACDPAFLKNAKRIETLSYAEIRALSKAGANVLHGDATLPLKNKNIPIVIGNTFDERGTKTTVCKSVQNRKSIAGLAVKKCENGYVLTAVDEKTDEKRLKRELLAVFNQEKIPVLGVGTNKYAAYVQTTERGMQRAVQVAHETFFEKN